MPKHQIDVNELLRETRQKLRALEKKVCRKCKEVKTLVQSGYCAECYILVQASKEKKRSGKKLPQESGYVYAYDDDGKLGLEHRQVMSKMIGRPLEKHEVVLHRDGDKSNNAPENLLLGFKNGTPLQNLECLKCGSVGEFKLKVDSDGT